MQSVYKNLVEIVTDSFSPALIIPEKNYKLYYSSIRNAYEALRQQPPFCHLKKGDVVTVSLPNSVEFVTTMFTVFSVRAVFNPVKVSFQGKELIEHLRLVQPRFVITSVGAPNSNQIIQESKKLNIPVFLVQCELIEQRFRAPQLLRRLSPVVAHLARTVKPNIILKTIDETPLSHTCKLDVKKYDRNDTALLLHTHGTTGPTKLVPLTQGAVLDNILLTSHLFELGAADRSYLIMPMYHSHGLIGVLLPSFLAGSTVLLATEMSMDSFWQDVLKYRVTWYSAVPLFHKMLMKLPKPTSDDFETSLRFVQSCGNHLKANLVLQLEQYLHVPIVTSYTMTEACHLVSTTIPHRTRKLDSVGQPTGISVKIYNEFGKSSAGLGEICISGTTVFDGSSNKDLYFTDDEIVWYRTGDMGWFDERGYLVCVGRKMDQIQVNGQFITPSLLENTISKHPAISEAVVFGVESEHSTCLEAGVVFKSGQKVSEADLKLWLQSWIPGSLPINIHFLAKIPQTSMGKLQRHMLTETIKKRAKL